MKSLKNYVKNCVKNYIKDCINESYLAESIWDVEDNIEDVVYSSTPNHIHNRPERAGSAWTDEEDARIKQEFVEGVSIKDIASLHNRTTGAIRSRLKKHKLIDCGDDRV